MPAGIQVINDFGSVMLDQNYFNFTLRSKGTVGINNIGYPFSGVGYGSTGYFGITVDADVPLLGLYSPYLTALDSISKSGSSWTFKYWCETNSGSIEWFLFDKANYAGNTDNVGLQVFNASGEKVFESSKGISRMEAFVTHTGLSNPSGFSQRSTYTAGKKYAVLHAQPAGANKPMGQVQSFTVIQRKYAAAKSNIAGGYIDFADMIAFQGNAMDPNGDIMNIGYVGQFQYKAMILDVTNL